MCVKKEEKTPVKYIKNVMVLSPFTLRSDSIIIALARCMTKFNEVFFCVRFFSKLADRHHGQTGVVRQQAEPAVGHERGVHAAGKADADHAGSGGRGTRVPVRAAGTPKHVASAHRGVPSRRAQPEPAASAVRRERRDVVGHHATGPWEAADGTAAAPGRDHEKVCVRVVRRAARARPAAGVPHEHARPQGPAAPASTPAAAACRWRRRPQDDTGRGTLTRAKVLSPRKRHRSPGRFCKIVCVRQPSF